ncbi:MAG TPA: VWA domain-containing protein [Spirochaetes bacterium]|nr:VWA domain-containing protein [Spirochaetota bacterium]
MKILFRWTLVFIVLFLVQCDSGKMAQSNGFTILSGSENKTLQPLLKDFSDKEGVSIQMKYKGSVDIMLELEKEDIPYDAVWPANSLWISIGDKKHRVKHSKSIMTSPVVFGIKKSLAKKLGFIGKPVRVKDILKAVLDKKLRFMMTSATQSNSGASAYIGFLYALLGNPEVIKKEDLKNPNLKKQIRKLFKGINRSSGSSGWLKDLFLKGHYDAMVNYEALIIEANQELIREGREPLYLVYPVDGLVLADSPLGYINKGDPEKEKVFKKLQSYLLSKDVQDKILGYGRRTGFGGQLGQVDKAIFNPAWGIDTNKILSPIKLPAADVIYESLNLYQTDFRKPSYTIFCLDYSGRMKGEGIEKLKEGMTLLLDQEIAKRYLIHTGSDDKIVVIPFSSKIISEWKTANTSEKDLKQLLQKILDLEPGGGTDIYSPVIQAISNLAKENIDQYVPAIILLTDGRSGINKFQELKTLWDTKGQDIPVFSILFGHASKDQLQEITDLTRGRIFDGRNDLVKAFRKAKGYN